MRIDWNRITAHYAISSLFETYPKQAPMFTFQVDREDAQAFEAGKTRLVAGKVVLTSTITGEAERFTYGAVHFGDHNVNGGVRTYQSDEAYQALVDDFAAAIKRVDVPNLVRLVDRHFGERSYTIESLFRDEQRRVLKRVLHANLTDIVTTFGKVYEQHLPIMRFLQHLHAPLPRPYQVTADMLFTTDLRWAFGDDDPDLDHIRRLVTDAAEWGIELPPKETGYRFAKMLRRYAERWHARPDQLDLLHGLVQGVELARTMPFEVDFWAPQNILFDVGKTTLPQMEEQAQAGDPAGREWLAGYLRLAEVLGVAVDELKKK